MYRIHRERDYGQRVRPAPLSQHWEDSSPAFISKLWRPCPGKILNILCPQFVPDSSLLNLQVHGNRNSMMQYIHVYSCWSRTGFFLFGLCLTETTFTTTIGAYCFCFVFFEGMCFISERNITLEIKLKSDFLKCTTITWQQQKKNALYFLHVVIWFKEAVSVTVHQMEDCQFGQIVQFISNASRWQHLLISASVPSRCAFCLMGAQ